MNCYSYITVGRQLNCVCNMVKTPPYQKRVDILCPSLILMAPALAVEPSARDWIPVHKELTPRSVQRVLH